LSKENTRSRLLISIFVALTLIFATVAFLSYTRISNVGESSIRTFTSTETITSITTTSLIQTVTSQVESQSLSSFNSAEFSIPNACLLGTPVNLGWQSTTANSTGQQTTDFFKPVLEIERTSSPATICVSYQETLNSTELSADGFDNKMLNFTFGLRTCQKVADGVTIGLQCSSSTFSPSAMITPNNLVLTNKTAGFTVIYNVTIPSAGFFDFAGDTYAGFLLSVGYPPNEVNATDFHIAPAEGGGLFSPIRPVYVTVSGVQVDYLDFRCPPTPPQCFSG